MVYLLNMVIFHGYVSHKQMVIHKLHVTMATPRHAAEKSGSVSFMEAAAEALKAMQRAHAGEPRERFGIFVGAEQIDMGISLGISMVNNGY